MMRSRRAKLPGFHWMYWNSGPYRPAEHRVLSISRQTAQRLSRPPSPKVAS